MTYNQPAMAAFAQQVIADCNGRMVTPTGESLNMDGRYGWQCMDLFIYIRYHLGFRDFLPTPDAASVWELNWTHPESTMWNVFDGITPDKPCFPGDIGIMNRQFFNNGVGHIFMIVADLGASIRVLELNGLGDGREDDAGNQYGSPARIHDWPKTYLYGYLRWIGPAPTVSALGDTIIPIQEDQMTPEQEAKLDTAIRTAQSVVDILIKGGDSTLYRASLQNLIDDIPRRVREEAAVTRNGVKTSLVQEVANTNSNAIAALGGLATIAQGVGDIRNRPTAAAPVIDVPALAAQIAAALNASQAHDFLVAFHNALPAN